jgi:hypothetical protein
MSGERRRAEIVRNYLWEHVGAEALRQISALIARAVDTAHPGPRLTLSGFVRAVEADPQLRDALLSTAALDKDGHATWAFIRTHSVISPVDRAADRLETARSQLSRARWERDKARRSLDRLDEACASYARKVEAAEHRLEIERGRAHRTLEKSRQRSTAWR